MSRSAPHGAKWPRITVITPSFNQGAYIEETIRSILLQGYPDLEYLVIDGGSTDETVEIIRKYEPWISYWVSERDQGQADAVNKGLARATGDLFNFINSDDLLLPDSLAKIAAAHLANPSLLIAGDVVEVSGGSYGNTMGQSGLVFQDYLQRWWELEWSQAGIFYPMSLARQIGSFREDMHFSFDYEYICRCLAVTEAHAMGSPVAVYRSHPQTKTLTRGHYFSLEHVPILKYWQQRFPDWDWRAGERVLAADLFRSGTFCMLHGLPNGWKFMRAAIMLRPFWAVYSVSTAYIAKRAGRLARELVFRPTSRARR